MTNRFFSSCAALTGLTLLMACNSTAQSAQTAGAQSGAIVSVTADVWVDNWFAMHVNGVPVLEDSTAFNTERSFNSDSATFDITLPATVAIEFRDFYENDTGLEYIGSNRQQLGDGGGVAQIKNAATGETLLVTNGEWKCKVIHQAPLNRACRNERDPQVGQGSCQANITAAPDGWTQAGFDDSGWSNAQVYSSRDVSPKRDYSAINWDSGAQFIWGDDLEIDNVVLCRAHIDG